MPTRRSKRPGKGREVEVLIRLGDLEPSKEQAERLKVLIECQVLTWVKADLSDKRAIGVICNDEMYPPKDE